MHGRMYAHVHAFVHFWRDGLAALAHRAATPASLVAPSSVGRGILSLTLLEVLRCPSHELLVVALVARNATLAAGSGCGLEYCGLHADCLVTRLARSCVFRFMTMEAVGIVYASQVCHGSRKFPSRWQSGGFQAPEFRRVQCFDGDMRSIRRLSACLRVGRLRPRA